MELRIVIPKFHLDATLVIFLYSLKTSENFAGFFMFSGGIEIKDGEEIINCNAEFGLTRWTMQFGNKNGR